MSTRHIATWTDLADGVTGWDSPEEHIAHFVAEEGGEDVYDLPAVQRAYRQVIEQALPAGFHLTDNAFVGPFHGDPDDAPLGDVIEAISGPVGGHEGDDYLGQSYLYLRRLAEPYRITDATTRVMYATWQHVCGEQNVETTVSAALSTFGRAHVEELADSGKYDLETLGRAVSGGFGTPGRVLDVAAAYREAVNTAAPQELAIVGNDIYGPYPRRDIDIKAALQAVDLGNVIARCTVGKIRELWTAEQAAAAIGASTAASARRTLSRWGVKAVRYDETDSGRLQSLYDAQQVRDAHARRPGRGFRTDKRTA